MSFKEFGTVLLCFHDHLLLLQVIIFPDNPDGGGGGENFRKRA